MFPACDTLFVIGFNDALSNGDPGVSYTKVTWTLHITRPCTTGLYNPVNITQKSYPSACIACFDTLLITLYTPLSAVLTCPGYTTGTVFYTDMALTTPFNGGGYWYGYPANVTEFQINSTGQITACNNCSAC